MHENAPAGEITRMRLVGEARRQLRPRAALYPLSADGERHHRCVVFHAGNPAVIGNPLDRWLCDPFFRKVCLLQMCG
jgi:hypothetical protein